MIEYTHQQLALHCFATLPKYGAAALAKIIEQDPVELWNTATLKDFEDMYGAKRGRTLHQGYAKVDPQQVWDKEVKYLKSSDIGIITIEDEDYPEQLHHIHRPPVILYVRGNLQSMSHTLAIIGTRKFSTYGEHMCYQMAAELGKSGMTIVSGLALGIDSIAHQGCLEAGGKTLAVLGGGLDDTMLYPKQNYHLAHKILATCGALISEIPPLMSPRKEFFPPRNRIVAGISQGILVIEAPIKSGTMITVEFGLQQNKDIFALPGNVTQKSSEGTNHLIKQGAYLVTKSEDILKVYNVDVTMEQRHIDEFPPEQQRVVQYLSEHSATLGKMSEDLQVDLTDLMTNISLLELTDVLTQDSQGEYHLKVRVV